MSASFRLMIVVLAMGMSAPAFAGSLTLPATPAASEQPQSTQAEQEWAQRWTRRYREIRQKVFKNPTLASQKKQIDTTRAILRALPEFWGHVDVRNTYSQSDAAYVRQNSYNEAISYWCNGRFEVSVQKMRAFARLLPAGGEATQTLLNPTREYLELAHLMSMVCSDKTLRIQYRNNGILVTGNLEGLTQALEYETKLTRKISLLVPDTESALRTRIQSQENTLARIEQGLLNEAYLQANQEVPRPVTQRIDAQSTSASETVSSGE